MKFQPGMSVTSIARPLTEEALDAIEQSEGLVSFETNPALFDVPDGEALLDRFVSIIRRRRIATPTYHCSFGPDRDPSSPDRAIRAAAISGLIAEFSQARSLRADIVVLHPSYEPIPDGERGARLETLRVSLSEIEERVRRYGYRVALELLPRTCLGNTVDELLEITEDFGDDFGFCLDVNHMMERIDEIPDAVRRLSKRLYALHVSDYYGEDECHNLPGDGRIDWPAFVAALEEVGYDGPFTYEVRIEGSPAERIQAVVANWKTVFSA